LHSIVIGSFEKFDMSYFRTARKGTKTFREQFPFQKIVSILNTHPSTIYMAEQREFLK
jgi:hypothetical protein